MDGIKMLKADAIELRIMEALARATDDALFKLQKRQAALIAESVSKMFKR